MGREVVLVTLMAVAVTLSAFSVWQATRASDLADDVTSSRRAALVQQQMWAAQLQTYVDHDVRTVAQYCSTLVAFEAERYKLLGPDPDGSGVLPVQVALQSLNSQMLGGDAESACPRTGESTSSGMRALGSWALSVMPQYPGIEVDSAPRLADLNAREYGLMTAGLAFSLALFGLVGVDVLSDRRHRPRRISPRGLRMLLHVALAMAVSAIASGLVLLVWFGEGAAVGAGLGLVLTVLVVQWWLDRRHVGPRWSLQRPHWWAEVAAALTVVAFSATAIGLSLSTGAERSLRATADNQRSLTAALAHRGHAQALWDLSAAHEVAVLDARVAAANLRGDYGEAEATDQLRGTRETFVDSLVAAVGQPALAFSAPSDCPTRAGSRSDARSVLDSLRQDDDGAVRHIFASQKPAFLCATLADRSNQSADGWSSRSSSYTVALVLLGLSGFLLALASDGGRTRRMSSRLLLVGITGAALGSVVAVTVPVGAAIGDGRLRAAEEVEFARDVAEARIGVCDQEILDRAIERTSGYGPAYAQRALARACENAAIPAAGVLSSELRPEVLSDFTADLATAVDLGPRTPGALLNFGWALILSGLNEGAADADALLRRGFGLTRSAVTQLESHQASAGTTLHAGRFNAALARAALGDTDGAATDYRRAVRCLNVGAMCPGGGIGDASSRLQTALWALADIELLDDERDIGALQEVVVSALAVDRGDVPRLADATLDVFPQEVRVSTEEQADGNISVVWYFRPSKDVRWGVLDDASQATVIPGDHLNRLIATEVALPEGEYRADLFSRGRKIQTVEKTRANTGVSQRVSTEELSLTAVVPDTWTAETQYAGTDWAATPHADGDTGLWVHRSEGYIPEGDVAEELDATLQQWLEDTVGPEMTERPHDLSRGFFVGLESPRVWKSEDGSLLAGIGVSSYTPDVNCGGSLVMAAVSLSAGESELVREVFNSLVAEKTVPPLADLDRVQATDFAIDVPENWVGARRPLGVDDRDVQARECFSGSNILVTAEDDVTSVNEVVDGMVAEYRSDSTFQDFALVQRRRVQVAGAADAVEIAFTWTSSDNGPVMQRQLCASNGATMVYVTSTSTAPVEAEWQTATDEAFASLALTRRG